MWWDDWIDRYVMVTRNWYFLPTPGAWRVPCPAGVTASNCSQPPAWCDLTHVLLTFYSVLLTFYSRFAHCSPWYSCNVLLTVHTHITTHVMCCSFVDC